MKLSTRIRYASRALAELAADGSVSLSVREVADRQQISGKYLEHIFKTLTSAGLLRVTRGRYGGYQLARPAELITLLDLYEVLEGPNSPVECVDHPERCSLVDVCPTRDTWVELKEAIRGVLERTTIHHLAKRQQGRRSLPRLKNRPGVARRTWSLWPQT